MVKEPLKTLYFVMFFHKKQALERVSAGQGVSTHARYFSNTINKLRENSALYKMS